LQKHERQVNSKKSNPLETLIRTKMEQKMSSKEHTASKAYRKRRGKQADVKEDDKNDGGTKVEQGNANKEGGNTQKKDIW
jgi:hypothetical protein